MGLYDATVGTLLIGIFFNTFLYGLVMYQFVAYYQAKFNDRPATKYTVLFLFILDTFHSVSAIYMAWYYIVANYGNPAALAVGVWPYSFTVIGTALAALVTQLYLGFRIWCLTGSKFLYGVVIALAIPSFVLGFACGTAAWIIHIPELPRITPLFIAWLSTQVVVDMFITITLVIVFIRARTGFRKTDTILDQLIRGAIQTGLFAGIFCMGDLITSIVLPNTNLYGMFAVPIGRIYTSTLLDTLLTRESLKTEMDGTRGESSSLHWAAAQLSQSTSTSTAQTASIQLQVQNTGEEPRSACQCADGKVVPLVV